MLGVVSGSGEDARVAYATPMSRDGRVARPDRALAAGAMLRLAAKCEEKRCTHFDGTDGRLAARISSLAAVSQKLPPYAIRPTCRWHIHCYRCPQIVTNEANRSDKMAASIWASGRKRQERFTPRDRHTLLHLSANKAVAHL